MNPLIQNSRKGKAIGTGRSVVACGQASGEGVNCEGVWENLGWWICSTTWFWWRLHVYMQLSKFIELYDYSEWIYCM